MSTDTDGTPLPIIDGPSTAGGAPLAVLGRYTVADLAGTHPDLARLAAYPGGPVLAVTCRRPHLPAELADDPDVNVVARDGNMHLLAARPDGGPTDNLADLVTLAVEHEVDEHGDPAACSCPNARWAGTEPQEIHTDPGCPVHGEPATALAALAAQAAEDAQQRCQPAYGDVDILPALRDATHTAVNYTLAAMGRVGAAERAKLEERLAELAALPDVWDTKVDGTDRADVLARVSAITAGFYDRPGRAAQVARYHAVGVAQAAAGELAAALGMPGHPSYDHDYGAAVFAAATARLTGRPAAVDWRGYPRALDPGAQVDGIGDLCLFLGGSWETLAGQSSFTGEVLKLIVKAQATPENFLGLALAFPRVVTAWRTWMDMRPIPTAAELAAELTRRAERPRS